MRLLLAFFALCLAFTSSAQASSEPSIEPIPAWVEQVASAEADPQARDRPFQTLLISSQSLYGAEQHDHFTQIAYLIQNQQGLQGLGNIVLPWRPDDSDLIIHKVRILRNGAVIDLLAAGQRFTVLRRENNLESAVLDGVLTAVMQAEGLTIGDVLDVAFTVRRRAATLPLRGENFHALTHNFPIRRFHVRQVWPTAHPFRWEATPVMGRPQLRNTRLGTELVLNLTDAEGPEPPAGAPPRFMVPARLQVSEYRGWSEISALLAPHYERAQQLAEGSPLRTEIDRIAAASSDPAVRTMAALRLVQDEIRYFALTIGDGNFLPATAEQTWTRRYGDCKGKTVTLLALLRGLGIEAEPMLVHSHLGDTLPERLPQLGAFNHVIVRAVIDGRTYWLDGTRTGDRRLDELASSLFGWGLPLRPAGAELEQMAYAPPPLPLYEFHIVYDGSQGFEELVPTRSEFVFRGDLATATRQAVSQVGRAEYLRGYRETLEGSLGEGEVIESVELRDDPDQGSLAVVIASRTRLDWERAPGAAAQRIPFDQSATEWSIEPERPEGQDGEAPFALPVPAHSVTSETYLLPNGGAGFTIEGEGFDHRVGGAQASRVLQIEGGRAVARSTFRYLQREVSAADAATADPVFESVGKQRAYLRGPMTLGMRRPGPSAPSTARPAVPDDADALVSAGFEKMDDGRVRQALADFDRAIELAPEWSLAHADRGIALVHLERLAEAEQALTTALRLDPTEPFAHQGWGLLRLVQDRPEEAVQSLTRSLELTPDNAFSFGQRAAAYERLGRFEDALADYDRVLAAEPQHSMALGARARILAHLGRTEEAARAAEAAVAADPSNFLTASWQGDLLRSLGREEEAQRAYQAALRMVEQMSGTMGGADSADFLALKGGILNRSGRHQEAVSLLDTYLRRRPGNIRALSARCQLRAEANRDLQLALRDCNEAIEGDPGFVETIIARAVVHLRLGRWTQSIRDFDRALELSPRQPLLLMGRGLARLGAGQEQTGRQDIAAARRIAFDSDDNFQMWGIAVPAAEAPATASAATPG